MTRSLPPAGELPPGAWPWLHAVARWIGTWWYRPFFRVCVHHRERIPTIGPVVLVANHSTMVEGPLLFGLLRRAAVFLVKRELFVGVIGRGLHRIGQLAVRRGEPDRVPLLAAQAVLRAGGVVGVFPEGTRGAGSARGWTSWWGRLCMSPLVAAGPGWSRAPRPSGPHWPQW